MWIYIVSRFWKLALIRPAGYSWLYPTHETGSNRPTGKFSENGKHNQTTFKHIIEYKSNVFNRKPRISIAMNLWRVAPHNQHLQCAEPVFITCIAVWDQSIDETMTPWENSIKWRAQLVVSLLDSFSSGSQPSAVRQPSV